MCSKELVLATEHVMPCRIEFQHTGTWLFNTPNSKPCRHQHQDANAPASLGESRQSKGTMIPGDIRRVTWVNTENTQMPIPENMAWLLSSNMLDWDTLGKCQFPNGLLGERPDVPTFIPMNVEHFMPSQAMRSRALPLSTMITASLSNA